VQDEVMIMPSFIHASNQFARSYLSRIGRREARLMFVVGIKRALLAKNSPPETAAPQTSPVSACLGNKMPR
jgi:hypothetical protein